MKSLFFSIIVTLIIVDFALVNAKSNPTDFTLEKDGIPVIASSMVISNDRILYYGSTNHYFYARKQDRSKNDPYPDESKGEWKYKTGGKIISTTACSNDGTLYFGSSDSYFYALNYEGTLKWRFKTEDEIWSSPALSDNGTVYVGSCDYYLYSLSPEGDMLWRYQTGAEIISSPALGSDGTVYIGSLDSCMYALNADGSLKWKYRTGDGIISSPAVDLEGILYFGSNDSYLYAINPAGRELWRFETGGAIISSPALDSNGSIYFGSSDSCFYSLDKYGNLKWKYEEKTEIWSSPVISSDGSVSVCTNNFAAWDGSFSESGRPVGVPDLSIMYDSSGQTRAAGGGSTGTSASPFVGIDGGVYIYSGGESGLYRFEGMKSPEYCTWPKFRHDYRNTGNIAAAVRIPTANIEVASSRTCDFTGEGNIAVNDVIAFLLLARDDPANPGLDWNGDGGYNITDAISLLTDILNGNCQGSSPLLASTRGVYPTFKMTDLTGSDLEYLERAISMMDLSHEHESTVRLELYGNVGWAGLPKAFSLEQNIPNPFNPVTAISYSISEGVSVRVTLNVYDIRGHLVRRLFDGLRDSGSYSVFWDGTDDSGRRVSSGVYMYRIEAGTFAKTRKMVLLK